MATSTNFVSALGAGSGIDIKSLAESLVEAERAPRKERIDGKIKQAEARISGYSAVKYALSSLKGAFEKLNDATDFSSLNATNSQPASFAATPGTSAMAGSYSIEVLQVARAQRSASNGFAARSTPLNGGNPFSLDLSINGAAAQTINVTTATPAGMVSAINSAKLGVSAQLIQSGDPATPWTIVLTGKEGAAQSFTLTSRDSQGDPVSDASFTTSLQTSADASFKVNGLLLSRSNNTVSDVIDGVTLDLYAASSGAARLDLNRESGTIKDNLNALVTSYNEFTETLKILGDSKSEVEDFGGVLAGENLLQTIKTQVRELLTANSSTPGTTIKAPRDVGLSIDRNGVLQLDEARLDSALQNNFDEVMRMFSAGSNNKSVYSPAPAGTAGRAVRVLDEMMRSTGLVAKQTESYNSKIEQHQAELDKLQSRMDKLLERYMTQFSLMENIVGNSNSLRTSLTSSFEGMMNAYKR
jgi:flagellar hook-associated protein 2